MDIIFDLIKKFWLRYKSIPFVFVFLIMLYRWTISRLNTTFSELISNTYVVILFLFLFVVYIFLCIDKNRLPRAPKNTPAILFVFDSENDKIYKSLEYNIVNTFNDLLAGNCFYRFKAVCIDRRRVQKYDLHSKDDMQKLLLKTNCLFLANINFKVDDADNISECEMIINNAVIHPTFSNLAEAIFSRDLNTLTRPIGKQKFSKAQKIDVFNFTANTLSYLCQYLLGFALLLSGEYSSSIFLLKGVLNTVQNNDYGKVVEILAKQRLFSAYVERALTNQEDFTKRKNTNCLELARKDLLEANKIFPNTYIYNIEMAYICIILNKDGKKAAEYISYCKNSKDSLSWKYSDAFLSAYNGQSMSTIHRKYRSAFLIPYNLVDLADYIEYVLENEPDKINLHFAIGLIYNEIDDRVLMKHHFCMYMNLCKNISKNNQDLIAKLISSKECMLKCDHNCISCLDNNPIAI